MAAAVPSTFASLYGNAALWENPSPAYDVLADQLGAGAGRLAAPDSRVALCHLSVRSPLVVAFVADNDPNHIYVAHSLSMFPSDITDATTMDGAMIGIVGNEPASCVYVVFSGAFLTVTAATRCLEVAEITGPAGHGAAPAVFRTGPHAAAAPGTSEVRGRPFMVLPPPVAARALTDCGAAGRYTLLAFYNTFLNGPLNSGDAAQVAHWLPVTSWWRLASTDRAGALATVISAALIVPATPHEHGRLAAWGNRVKDNQLARLGMGGPQLSNAAFARGVLDIQDTLGQTAAERIRLETARANKTFTEVHGQALGELMHRLCDVTSDVHLPEVHGLLLKTVKSRVYALLGGLFQQRTRAAGLPLLAMNAPLASTKLVDQVFRSYQPGGTGLEFGQGLTPFAIVLPGHEGAKIVEDKIRNAQLIEGGTSVSLADATSLVSEDVRFPTKVHVAVEKLYGWSIVLDVFHGPLHPISIAIRMAVASICPQLQRMSDNVGDDGAGLDIVCRIMYEMQQDYFSWLARVSLGATVIPDFSRLIDLVSTSRASSLSALPAHWYNMLSSSLPAATRNPAVPLTAPAAVRESAVAVPVVNTRADARLVQRFTDTGHQTIKAMTGDRQIAIPKHNGKEVCLTWAFKGACQSNCKRKALHVAYNRATISGLHEFMTACGVAPAPNA